jgi:hypothetical protein
MINHKAAIAIAGTSISLGLGLPLAAQEIQDPAGVFTPEEREALNEAIQPPGEAQPQPSPGQLPDGQLVPEPGQATDGQPQPSPGQPTDGQLVPEPGQATDGQPQPSPGQPTDGQLVPEPGQATDGQPASQPGQPGTSPGNVIQLEIDGTTNYYVPIEIDPSQVEGQNIPTYRIQQDPAQPGMAQPGATQPGGVQPSGTGVGVGEPVRPTTDPSPASGSGGLIIFPPADSIQDLEPSDILE